VLFWQIWQGVVAAKPKDTLNLSSSKLTHLLVNLLLLLHTFFSCVVNHLFTHLAFYSFIQLAIYSFTKYNNKWFLKNSNYFFEQIVEKNNYKLLLGMNYIYKLSFGNSIYFSNKIFRTKLRPHCENGSCQIMFWWIDEPIGCCFVFVPKWKWKWKNKKC
jgi:hypothetical protein